jgi:hypothetical protein
VPSIAGTPANTVRKSVKASDLKVIQGPPKHQKIPRASTAFILNNNSDNDIENERLKTTLMILSQKLKMKEDDENEKTEKLLSIIN